MKKKFDRVYQFKITLASSKPPIWRRIHVPETYTFWDLHIAIQDAMGWQDCHLHEFEMLDPKTGEIRRIGISDEKLGFGGVFPDDEEILDELKKRIKTWFSLENSRAGYTYDFGDGWEHFLELEKILPRDKNVRYPICVTGKRACPPENCGGIWGYESLLEILKDPDHEEYEDMLDWVGGELDPKDFDPKKVVFTNPDKRPKPMMF